MSGRGAICDECSHDAPICTCSDGCWFITFDYRPVPSGPTEESEQ